MHGAHSALNAACVADTRVAVDHPGLRGAPG